MIWDACKARSWSRGFPSPTSCSHTLHTSSRGSSSFRLQFFPSRNRLYDPTEKFKLNFESRKEEEATENFETIKWHLIERVVCITSSYFNWAPEEAKRFLQSVGRKSTNKKFASEIAQTNEKSNMFEVEFAYAHRKCVVRMN